MKRFVKILLLITGGLILTVFALILLPLILIVLMIWMLFGGSRMRVFTSGRQPKYEFEEEPSNSSFSSEQDETRYFTNENDDVIDITAKEVKDKE